MWYLVIVRRFVEVIEGFIIVEAFELGPKVLLPPLSGNSYIKGVYFFLNFLIFPILKSKTISLTSSKAFDRECLSIVN